jgi:MFS family permease
VLFILRRLYPLRLPSRVLDCTRGAGPIDQYVQPGRGMMMKHATPSGVPLSTMTALMLAVFTVSVGYGVVLPLLPYLIELLGTTGGTGAVPRSTGLLTGLYMLALFLFAPAWGRMSDRYGRRIILLIGLAGFGAIMLIFSLVESLTAVYAERFLSGVFATAVTPVALAAIGDLAATEEARARRLTFVSLAGISGFLLGPMVGVAIARGASNIRSLPSAAGSLAFPLAATGILALLAAIAAAVAVPGTQPGDAAHICCETVAVRARSRRGLTPARPCFPGADLIGATLEPPKAIR